MTGFGKVITRLINLGVYNSTNTIRRRRIKLVNSFNLIGCLIILIFFLMNLAVGSHGHALKILSGLIVLSIPVFLLNKMGRIVVAKYYFVIVSLVFAHVIGYLTIFSLQNRDNEFFFVGYSTIIIALFDNPAKRILFFTTVLSVVVMKLVRFSLMGQSIMTDEVLSISNLVLGFICVYFFTDIFKNDLLKSETRIRRIAEHLDHQSTKINFQNEELEASKEMLNTTVDNIPVFIAMLDTDGNFIMANERFSEVLLKPKDEIDGKNYDHVFGTEIAALAKPLFDQSLEGKVVEINHPITFPSGENIHAFGKYIPLLDHNGTVSRVLTYVIDIQELKASERALREINNSKDKIMSILSHDLRSPLNSLRGLLNISESIDEKDLKLLINNIGRQVETLGFTLTNLLNWVKTQLEGFEPSQERIKISSIIEESIALYRPQLVEKEIELTNEIDHDNLALVDPNHFALIIRNLLNNAIKFTPENGIIGVRSFVENGHVLLEIKDNGVGMTKEVVEAVLNPISKLKPISSVGTNGEKGTGLGLGFCNDILKLNQGHMTIQSEERVGTNITISLPSGK